MWTIHSVVLFSLWTLVYGVRVPNEWNEAAETNVNNVRNPVYGYYPSNTPQRAYIDSTPGKKLLIIHTSSHSLALQIALSFKQHCTHHWCHHQTPLKA